MLDSCGIATAKVDILVPSGHEGDCIDVRDLNLPAASAIQPAAETDDFGLESVSLETYLENIEKQALMSALKKNGGNKIAAARQLGMTIRSLCYRMKKLGLD